MLLKKTNQAFFPFFIFSLETAQEGQSSTGVSVDVESPEESNIFQPIQTPVNNSYTVEGEVIDEEYWNHPLEKINALLQMTVMLSQKTCFCNQNCCQRNLIKDTTGAQNMRKIIAGYISSRHIEVGCATHATTQFIAAFHQHDMSERDIHQEKIDQI